MHLKATDFKFKFQSNLSKFNDSFKSSNNFKTSLNPFEYLNHTAFEKRKFIQ